MCANAWFLIALPCRAARPLIQLSSPFTVFLFGVYPGPPMTQLIPAASATMHSTDDFLTIVILRWYGAKESCPAMPGPMPEPVGLPFCFALKYMKGMIVSLLGQKPALFPVWMLLS